MSSPKDQLIAKVSLIREAEIALFSIESGLAALQLNRPYAAKPYYFIWMTLLATGLERFMKLLLCLESFDKRGAFLTTNDLRKYGHDLTRLKDDVLLNVFGDSYRDSEFKRSDTEFLRNNLDCEMLLSLLSDFARTDRYRYMDQVADPRDDFEIDEPKIRWESLEKQLIGTVKYLNMLGDNAKYSELKVIATRAATALIERLTRALTRPIIYGAVGTIGSSNHILVYEFATLGDNELGHKKYAFGDHQ